MEFVGWWQRWRAKIIDVIRHPWRSLVSLLAGVTDVILWIWRLLLRGLVWVGRQLHRLMNISLWGWIKGFIYAVVVLCAILFVGTLFLINYPTTKVPNFEPVDQRVYISQGWGWTGGQTEPARQLFYFTPQGAGLKDIRYSWFVNLEVPWGTEKFADPERMSAYGFLVDKMATPMNPDRLPVGFAAHYDAKFGEYMLDLSCAACHTGELVVNKKGKRYGLRVDGAGAMHAFTAMHIGDFAPELLGSLAATYLNPFKFDRFAQPVLGPAYPQGRWKLHGDLRQVIGRLLSQVWNENIKRHLYPTEEGPGRIDALGRIANTVFGEELSSVNYGLSNAPVRYPPLWDIWKFDHVQYNASVRQPMTRNVSESLGTGARAELLNAYGGPIPGEQRFDTSVMLDNLGRLEMALWSLDPPRWSEDCLGKIDWDRAKRGRQLFEQTCRHCHGPFPASEPIKEWYAYLKTQDWRDVVNDDWQKFMNSLYEGSSSTTEGPDLEDRAVTTEPQPPQARGLVLRSSFPSNADAPSSQGDQLGITPSQQEENDLLLHKERSPGPTLAVAPTQATPPASPAKPAPASTSPAPLTIPFAPLQRAPGGEETREGALRTPGPPGPSGKGNAPRVSSDFPLWVMHPLTVEDIGTDPTTAVNFLEKTIDVTKAGLSPAISAAGMRTLLEEDLTEETDAYAKEILRLTGKQAEYAKILGLAGDAAKNPPQINSLTSAQRQALRKGVLAIADVTPSPKAATAGDQDNLDDAIATFKDAIYAGPSRIDSFLASMDLHALNTGVALRLIVFRTRQRYYDLRNYTQPDRNLLNGFGELDVPVPYPQYKPRPLAGIWAAGPFLHNGSVPTIYQMLLPADQRDKKFFVGTRDFDSANLGFRTEAPDKNGFWLDTSITGNSNLGHEFRKGYVEWSKGSAPQYGVIGPELTEEQRRDILEYLKIHRDEHTKNPTKDLDGYLREGLDLNNVCQ